MSALEFTHRFEPATDTKRTLLLLHGTGGDENDLLPLGRELMPGAGLLSPRGKILENGMPRFFKRTAEGHFHQDDLRMQTRALGQFVKGASRHYDFDLSQIVAVGYSNGANIASSLLLTEPQLLTAAVLFRPMVPFVPTSLPSLAHIPVLLAAGRRDSIVIPGQTFKLAEILEEAGALVSIHWYDGGHELGRHDVVAAKNWLKRTFLP